MIENPFSLSFGMKPVSYWKIALPVLALSSVKIIHILLYRHHQETLLMAFFDINGISIFYLMRKTKQTLSANICIDVKNKERIRRSLMQWIGEKKH